jgi:excisionase family DNA binding protein
METLNKTELAEALGVSRTTVDSWTRRGCPYVSRGRNGREWRFNLEEVERWRYRQGYGDPAEPLMREMSAKIIGDSFTWFINDAGPAWSGMMKEIGVSDDKFIRKLYVFTYIIFNYSVHELLRTQLRQNKSIEMPEMIRTLLEEDPGLRNAAYKFCKDKK